MKICYGVKIDGEWTNYIVEKDYKPCKIYTLVLDYMTWLAAQDWVEDVMSFEVRSGSVDNAIDLFSSFGVGFWNNQMEKAHAAFGDSKYIEWSGENLGTKTIYWRKRRENEK